MENQEESIATPKKSRSSSLVYFEAQRLELLAQLQDWGGLLDKSAILSDMEGDEHFLKMCRDMTSADFWDNFRGDKEKELHMLTSASQMLVRHIGKVDAAFQNTVFRMKMAQPFGVGEALLQPYEAAIMRIIRKYKPSAFRRKFRLYDRQFRIQAMTIDLQHLFTRVINDVVVGCHQDYRYEWHPLAMGDWMQYFWCVCMDSKSAPPVMEAIREEFFMEYWKDVDSFTEKLAQTVTQHFKEAQKLLSEVKNLHAPSASKC